MRLCRAKQQAAAAAGSVISPITGELIPLDQMQEHMRVSLIDPKWKAQRDTMLSKIRETTKANDDEIGRNLLGLARHRPDVFGDSLLPREPSTLQQFPQRPYRIALYFMLQHVIPWS